MKYTFKSLGKNIYLLTFDNRYDLAMHFVRVQEFYECPNDEFRGKPFNIWDYMEWYAKDNNGVFTYTKDWSGFNIPGGVLHAVYGNGLLPGWNKYDDLMCKLYKFMDEQSSPNKMFYLIGAEDGDEDTVKHEMAHALWTLDDDYRAAQQANINTFLNSPVLKKMAENLIGMGYTDSVINDEAQAYLSTGLTKGVSKGVSAKELKKVRSSFTKVFKKYIGS